MATIVPASIFFPSFLLFQNRQKPICTHLGPCWEGKKAYTVPLWTSAFLERTVPSFFLRSPLVKKVKSHHHWYVRLITLIVNHHHHCRRQVNNNMTAICRWLGWEWFPVRVARQSPFVQISYAIVHVKVHNIKIGQTTTTTVVSFIFHNKKKLIHTLDNLDLELWPWTIG